MRSARLASELVCTRIIDQTAETAREIADKNRLNVWQAQREVKKLVISGTLEQVWKKIGRTTIPAYRIKRK